MRTELELIKQIESYLAGELTANEKILFEEQIANDPDLQEAVQLQQQVMQGIERVALKQKVQQAKQQFKRSQYFKYGGSAGLIIVIIPAIVLYYTTMHHEQQVAIARQPVTDTSTSIYYQPDTGNHASTANKPLWPNADSTLPSQTFLLAASRDTVIETDAGIVLSIPANCFLDDHRQPVTGEVAFTVKEALDAATIMKAGLSSKSGSQLLESGGMFFTDARKNGQALQIDPANGIYTEVPTNTVKPGMQLYTGHPLANGIIDWVYPHPLEHDLVPIDIESLQFYPPGYLDSLERWGYDSHNKSFTDSLYYSLAAIFDTSIQVLDDYSKSKKNVVRQDATSLTSFPDTTTYGQRDTTSKPLQMASGKSTVTIIQKASSLTRTGIRPTDTTLPNRVITYPNLEHSRSCGINPAKIKAIWNKHFNNTLLSTREFEERVHWIHLAANNDILDLYVNNLDKKLSDIDSMAANRLTGEMKQVFLRFYDRHDGKVNARSTAFRRLRKYYEKKTAVYTQAIIKTQREFWSKQADLDFIASTKRVRHKEDSIGRTSQNFMEELELNIKNAWQQLGYKNTPPTTSRSTILNQESPRQPSGKVYRATVTNTGWCNIDRAVYTATANRTTLDFTDPQSAKRATIQYKPALFVVKDATLYDHIYVYLLPNQLSSFMRLTEINGQYKESLNELMQYTLVCIAYKEEQAFFYSLKNIHAADYPPIALAMISKNELDQQLKNAGGREQALDINWENEYFHFEFIDQKRRKHNKDMELLRYRIVTYFFPCFAFNIQK